ALTCRRICETIRNCMKTNIVFSAFGALLLVSSATCHAADPTDESQIRKIEQDWVNAIMKRDSAYITKLETDDFTMTGPDGKLLSKEEDLKNVTSPQIVFDDLKIDDLKIRIYGDTAVASGLGTLKGHDHDNDISGPYSWTDVFIKRGGEWKAIAAHVTTVANN